MSSWDYLILTASNARQAQAYESQLRLRRELGLLPRVCECFVAADLEDRRIGSGGSTVYCLEQAIGRASEPGPEGTPSESGLDVSRRLPA